MSVNKREPVVSTAAPGAIGPYSQGIVANEWVFLSGQVSLRADGVMASGGVAGQTEQCLLNVRALLTAAGLTMDAVVKTTVFLTDLKQFAAMNEVYGRHFHPPYPARSTVQVSALPRGADVEIEVIAVKSS